MSKHTYSTKEIMFVQNLLGAPITGILTQTNTQQMKGQISSGHRDITTAYIQTMHNIMFFNRTPLVVDGWYGYKTATAIKAMMHSYDIVTMPRKEGFDFSEAIAAALPLWSPKAHTRIITHFTDAFDLIGDQGDIVKMTSNTDAALFLGQVAQETGYSFRVKENLNYRPKSLRATFRAYRRNAALSIKDGRGPGKPADVISIANRAYANRYGNGNFLSGDGWKFSGAGIKQLTFHDNYKGYHDWLLKYLPDVYWASQGDKIMTHGRDIVSDSPHAVLSGLYYWANFGVWKASRHGVTRQGSDYATRVINKYTDSYAVRWKLTQRADKLIQAAA